jgi:uncharacterized membrane protein YkoI
VTARRVGWLKEREFMKTRLGWLAGVLLLALLVAGIRAEEKVPLDKLPKAVTDAVKAKFPRAALVSASTEKEDGKTVYEVAIKDGRYAIDVSVSSEGKILSIEKEIPAKEVPKVVADAFEARYAKVTPRKIEEVSKGDKVVFYEFLITGPDKKDKEVMIDPSGKILDDEKKK